jgi:hypothetical protein
MAGAQHRARPTKNSTAPPPLCFCRNKPTGACRFSPPHVCPQVSCSPYPHRVPVKAKAEFSSSLFPARSSSISPCAHEAAVEHRCSSRHRRAQPPQRAPELLPHAVLQSASEATSQRDRVTNHSGHCIVRVELAMESPLRPPSKPPSPPRASPRPHIARRPPRRLPPRTVHPITVIPLWPMCDVKDHPSPMSASTPMLLKSISHTPETL